MATQTELIDEIENIVQDESYTELEILSFMNRCVRQISRGMLIYYPDRTQAFSNPLPDLLTSDTVTTSTSVAYVSMPSDFGRDLIGAVTDNDLTIFSSYGEFLKYYPTLDNSGDVHSVAVRGSLLFYQGIPTTADDITLHYYRKPYDMASLSGTGISFSSTTSKISDTASKLGLFHVGQTIDITGTVSNNTSIIVTAVATDGSTLTTSDTLVTESAGTSFRLRSRPDGIPEFLHEDLLVNYAAWKIFDQIEEGTDGKKINSLNYKEMFMQAMLDLNAMCDDLREPIQFISAR